MSARTNCIYVKIPLRLFRLPPKERASAIEVWAALQFSARLGSSAKRVTDRTLRQTPFLEGRSRRHVCNGLETLEREAMISRAAKGSSRLLSNKLSISSPDSIPKIDYRAYLASNAWLDKRLEARKRAGNRCQVCNAADGGLDTHHRTYERLGDELPEDLIVLCRRCHNVFHGAERLGLPSQKEVG